MRRVRNGLTRMNGERYRQHRQLMLPTFSKKAVAGYMADMTAVVRDHLDEPLVGVPVDDYAGGTVVLPQAGEHTKSEDEKSGATGEDQSQDHDQDQSQDQDTGEESRDQQDGRRDEETLSAQPVDVHLVIDPTYGTVAITVNSVQYGTFPYNRFASSDSSRSASLTASGSAEFDYVRIREVMP